MQPEAVARRASLRPSLLIPHSISNVGSVIDLHCHVLPEIDDGPSSIEGSVALASAAASCGTDTLVATPHVNHVYHNDAETIAVQARRVQARLASEGVEVEIRGGAEIAAAEAAQMSDAELRNLGLGGSSWLLIEPPFLARVDGLQEILLGLQRRGHRVVLAHPERCPGLHRAPALLGDLVGQGVLTSITAGSLVGRFGADVRRFALELASEGLVHNVASDFHDELRRPPGIAGELAEGGLGQLADWLTDEVPAAVLADAELVPSRPSVGIPQVTGRRRRWRLHAS